ncbi:MAG: hypothetical protein M3Q37_09475 [Gemmatimonadota bacterium]|nr:hypothetical protein [Gemmatimonadota bacterium]
MARKTVAHPAVAQLALEPIAVSEGGAELGEEIGHKHVRTKGDRYVIALLRGGLEFDRLQRRRVHAPAAKAQTIRIGAHKASILRPHVIEGSRPASPDSWGRNIRSALRREGGATGIQVNLWR